MACPNCGDVGFTLEAKAGSVNGKRIPCRICPAGIPPTRPSFEEIYMRLAQSMSERSTCERTMSDGSKGVGCVITSTDFRHVYGVGYNGSAAGGPNGCDRHGAEAVGNCGCIHAEQNAVINCRADRNQPKIVFCTHLPCVMCAKFLINLGGVIHVYYSKDYRIRDGLDWLNQAGIETDIFPLYAGG